MTENPRKAAKDSKKESTSYSELSLEISLLLKDESLKKMLEGLTACAFSINSRKLFNKKADTAELNQEFANKLSEFRNSITSRRTALLDGISDTALYEKILQPLYHKSLSY